MEQIYSNPEHCHNLANILYTELKPKITFWGSTYQEVISGEYNSLPKGYYPNNQEYQNDSVIFYFKLHEEKFLRISIQNGIKKCSLGNRLAALSDFYSILKKLYGEATLFFTTKDDEKETLHLQWNFTKKQEEINAFIEGEALDDAETGVLIIIDDEENKTDVSKTTREYITRKIQLPYELLLFINLDSENFAYYKTGKRTSILFEDIEEPPSSPQTLGLPQGKNNNDLKTLDLKRTDKKRY